MEWRPAIEKESNTFSIPERWLHIHYYEALNILFRMENALRTFVYVVLKNELHEKWTDASLQISDGETSTIKNAAAKRIALAKGFGYLGYEIQSPLMYLNSGEMARLVVSETYWKYFSPYFKGSKGIIKTKLEEIGTVRNALAHFRPLKTDDIDLIKQNVKHVFIGIEECLNEITSTPHVVPTNTQEDWYLNLCGIKNDLCKIRAFQSKHEKWVRLAITYQCPVLKTEKHWDEYFSYKVLNIITPSIVVLPEYSNLSKLCTYISESIPYSSMPKEGTTPTFRKEISVVFSRQILQKDFKSLRQKYPA